MEVDRESTEMGKDEYEDEEEEKPADIVLTGKARSAKPFPLS